MSNASSKHSGFHLHRNDDGTTELQILHDGAEKVAMNATGISFLGSVAPSALTDITGNTSAYVEATLKLIIDTLVAAGLATDSTTT